MKTMILKQFGLWLSLAGLSFSCGRPAPTPRTLNLHQSWSLSTGTDIAGYKVSSGLGDISLALGGDSVRMPFDGKVEPTDTDCVIVSSADVPAYLFRLCGLNQPKLGERLQGNIIGRASHLVFAMLRREPDGTWAVVEPSPKFIEQLLAREPGET